MKLLIAAELRKLRYTRSAWIPLAVALVAAALSVFVYTSAAGTDGNPPVSEDWLPMLLRGSGGKLLNGAVLLSSLLLAAGEFRHRTSVTTFLGEPRRLRVVAAKVAAAILTGLAVGLAAVGIGALASSVAFAAEGVPLDWGDPAARSAVLAVPLLAALHGVLGVGLGLLLRNTALAVGATLFWAFVVEGALPVLLREPGLIRWLPGGAAQAALEGGPATALALSATAGLLVLTGYALTVLVAGAVTTTQREIGTSAG